MKPNQKMTAVGIAGAIATMLAFLFSEYTGLNVSDTVVSALTTLIAFGSGWFRNED